MGSANRHARSSMSHKALEIAEHDRLRSEYVRRLLFERRPDPSGSSAQTIPRVIVQFWHDSDAIPNDVVDCLATWERLNTQGFERRLFDDVEARRFISDRMGNSHAAAFDRCVHPAMRSDYFRLCYVLEMGGLYIDADDTYQGAGILSAVQDNKLKIQPLCFDQSSGCMVPAATFLRAAAPSPDWTFYVNNNPLVAPAHHPVLRLALARATRLLLSSERVQPDIQSVTGPGNLTSCLVRYAIASRANRKALDIAFLTNWESISVSQWPLSYRSDSRNWRLWRPD
jgi:mannosyltransferase OCH1-like enzyme